jgi:hypothetical protein
VRRRAQHRAADAARVGADGERALRLVLLRLEGHEGVRGRSATAERLRAAGFVEVETSLEPDPTILSGADEFREFLTTVNMRSHLARLPEGRLRRRFVEELTEQAAADDPPCTLDYCRLNIRALRPEAL